MDRDTFATLTDVGWINEYGTYLDAMWERYFPYFIRDYYISELRRDISPEWRAEVQWRLEALNSELSVVYAARPD